MISLFKTKNKEEIIKAAQNGNEEAIEYLINKNMGIVCSKAKFFFINGQEKDDVIQEGRIGLYKAIRDYKIEGNASFISFCHICVYRQLIIAIKSANRDKNFSYIKKNGYDEEKINDVSDRTSVSVRKRGERTSVSDKE